MKNPNAVAGLTVGSVLISGEELLQHYAALHLGPFWSRAVIVITTTAVLSIGRDGVKGSLLRALRFVRSIWSGSAKPAASGK